VLVLAEGVLVEEGAAEEVLSSPTHPATRELLSAPAAAEI
jgi:ABC-type dipeptide/oligopeptide/nickel transport system ATPase component